MKETSRSEEPIVAIVGRPNVGKSALFNRLVGKRVAIVDQEAGITRDRLYSVVEWGKKRFKAVDTGGLIFDEQDTLIHQVEKQAYVAIHEAQRILFVVDVLDGVTSLDKRIAELLRPVQNKVILVVNKVDNESLSHGVHECHAMGFHPVFSISSLHGRGIGDLLDAICVGLETKSNEGPPDSIQIAIVGKPNVGKSSYVNTILQEERNIVSDQPGTTRDSIDTLFVFRKRLLTLIDTAGFRRKRRLSSAVDHFSLIRARESIQRADVVVVMLDGMSGVTTGDLKIAAEVQEAGKASLIVVNKWDLLEETSQADFRADIKERLGFLNYSPILFTSVKTNKNINRSLTIVEKIYEESQKQFHTKKLNTWVRRITTKTPPPVVGTKALKIYFLTQAGQAPLRFIAFVNDPRRMKDSYRKFLINQMRKEYGCEGVPIVLRCKKSK